MACINKEKLNKFKEDSRQLSEEVKKFLKNTFPVQLPKNILRDLILSMDRGERRFVALKLRRYSKKGKDSSSVVKLYEILSRHASINKDEVETLQKYGGDIPHLEQVRQRLIKMILFALVEYRYFKYRKNIYVAMAEIVELLGKKHIGAAKTLFRRLTMEYNATTNPFQKVLIAEALTKIVTESGPIVDKKDYYNDLHTLIAYNFLEKALDDLYRYRKVAHAVNDLARSISKESFPAAKTLVGDMEQCVEDIVTDFLEGGFSVKEFQILYARLLYISVLFKKFEIAQKLYKRINSEFDLSNLKNLIESKGIDVELSLSIMLWHSHLGTLKSTLELGAVIINFIKENLFASDLKPLYLLEAYSRLIPVAWYTGNLDYAIDLVEDAEYILDVYGEDESYNKLAYFKVSKMLITIQGAVSYTAIGNFRFAKRLITSKDFKKEVTQNRGMQLISLLGSVIVFAESNEYKFLKETIAGLYEIAEIVANKNIFQKLIDIVKAVYVDGDKAHLKQNLRKAIQIATDLLKIDPLLYNAFHNSGFLHWLVGQAELRPFKEALKDEKILSYLSH